MVHPKPVAEMSYAEYVAHEQTSDARHEFLDGEIFAMAGGTPQHGALALAVGAEFRAALRGRPCRVFSSDVRIRVQETGLATYPDVSVVCGELRTHPEDPDAIANPVVLVEILSDSTEAYERGAKAIHYRRIPSLREYVLISQDEAIVEVHHRAESGRWEILEARAGERIPLEALDIALDVDAVYEDPLAPGGD